MTDMDTAIDKALAGDRLWIQCWEVANFRGKLRQLWDEAQKAVDDSTLRAELDAATAKLEAIREWKIANECHICHDAAERLSTILDSPPDPRPMDLKELRESKELSSEALADCAGLNRGMIRDVERGRCTLVRRSIAAIAGVLEVPISVVKAALAETAKRNEENSCG